MNIIREDSKLNIKSVKGTARVFWIDFGLKGEKGEQ